MFARFRSRLKGMARNALALTDYDRLGTGTVLAFDGALAKTGWAVVTRRRGHMPVLMDCGLVVTAVDPGLSSFEATFAKADQLGVRLRPIVERWLPQADEAVCERPAISGMRTESSLLAAYVVGQLTGSHLLVHRVHAVSVFCGPGVKPSNKVATKAVTTSWLPERPPGSRWNQDVADAALAALIRLYDRAHGSR